MFDFDPRDHDSREDERLDQRGNGGSQPGVDHDVDLTRLDVRSHDRDDDARTLGRGPGSDSRGSDSDGHGRAHDPRWVERDRGALDRDTDIRDVFTRDLNLPRGLERETVFHRDREYTLRGSEARTLATVGAFRVVSSRDLIDHRNRPADPRSGDLRHLREQGLIETVRVPGYREPVVVLTKEGRGLLESHRERDHHGRQAFYAGLKRAREVEHDSHVYRAYLREADRLQERGARIERVVLDHELKREYQQWLHARDRDRDDYDGHPDRSPAEIEDWAREHDLPYFDDEVHFPDVRIEYQDPDGRWEHEDVEVTTVHYRGAHGSSVARSGFVRFGASSVRVGRGGHAPDPRLAEELFR